MNITAKELSGQHIGKTITVTLDGATMSGLLSAIDYRADLITEQRLCELNPTLYVGQINYRIAIGHKEIDLDHDTQITIQEDK